MKLSNALRARVVELLRCAADNCYGLDTISGLAITSANLAANRKVTNLACDALVETVGDEGDDWVAACLEAALRVEEKLWP